jgi:ABC-2 type transport system permease protein
MKNRTRWFKNLIIPLLLIFAAQDIHYQWDVTQDQRYTLNETTKTLLEGLEHPLKIDVFLTGKLPAEYLRLQREITTLVKSMKKHTDQLIVGFVDPFEGGDPTETLIGEMTQYGLPPEYIVADQNQALEQTVVFPWAMINDGNKSVRIPLLEKVLGDDEPQKINRSIAQLEFHFFDALYKITQKQKPTLAVLTSHGTSEAIKVADFMQSLQPYYQLASFDLKALEDDPEKTMENLKRFPLLLVSNPSQPFTETEKYLLDQHLIGGGKQWWAINATAVNRDSLFSAGGTAVAMGRSLHLENLFFKYGFRLQKNLIKDLYCAPIVLANGTASQAQYLPYPWPYYPLSKPNENELFGSNAGNVILSFASTIDTLKSPAEKTVLIVSSDFSKSLQTPWVIRLQDASNKIAPATFNQSSQPMGVLLKGKFNSAFENRIKPTVLKQVKTTGHSELIVFSSGSIAENQVDKGKPLELGYDKWTHNFYFNKVFLQQSIHYMMGNTALLNIKKKSVVLPRLDPEKVKKISVRLKAVLLLSPLLVLFLIGEVFYRLRIRKFGQ